MRQQRGLEYASIIQLRQTVSTSNDQVADGRLVACIYSVPTASRLRLRTADLEKRVHELEDRVRTLERR